MAKLALGVSGMTSMSFGWKPGFDGMNASVSPCSECSKYQFERGFYRLNSYLLLGNDVLFLIL